jgi:putative hydrolase of the HAD superfamily
MSVAALLLDAGNTLVFLDFDAIAEVVAGAGVPCSPTALAAREPLAKRRYEVALAAGQSHDRGWDIYMEALLEPAVDPRRMATLVAGLHAEHARFNLWRAVPPGTRTALEALRQASFKIGVVSNSEGGIAALLDAVGLDDLFDTVVDSAREGVRKPDPEIFRRACARVGVAPGAALYAGDIPSVDVDGARAAGLQAILIDPFGHYPEVQPRAASVVEVARSLLAR